MSFNNIDPDTEYWLENYKRMREGRQADFLDADALASVAEHYYTIGQKSQGCEAADYGLSIYPGDVSLLAFKIRAALAEGKPYQEAEVLLNQITDTSDVEYLYLMAEILLYRQLDEKANSYLKEHFSDYDNEEEREDYILDVACIFADYDRFDYCDEWLQLSTLTDDDQYKELKGRVLQSRGNYQESQVLFNELIDRDPYSTSYWNRLAAAQLMDNNIKDSIASSEFSIAINPNDSEAILNKANGLYTLGNYEEAAKFYRQFSELEPDNEVGEMFTGISLGMMGQAKQAIPHLEKALTIARQDNRLSIMQELAFMESRTGNIAQAITYMDRLEQEGYDKHLANVYRGYIYLEQGMTETAGIFFKKALNDSRMDTDVQFHIAIAAYDLGYLNSAYKMLAMMLEDAGEEWTKGYAYLARCCYDLNKMDEYADKLSIAIDKNPEECRFVLAELYPEGTEPENYPDLTPQEF